MAWCTERAGATAASAARSSPREIAPAGSSASAPAMPASPAGAGGRMPRPSSKVVARRFRASSSETHERSSARSSGAPRVVVARASRGARLRVFSYASRRRDDESWIEADRLWFSVSARPISEAYLEVQAGPRRALRRRLAHAQRREQVDVRLTLPLARARARVDAPLSRGVAGARTWAPRAPTRRALARCVPAAAPRASRLAPLVCTCGVFERRFAEVALNLLARVPLFPDARRSAPNHPDVLSLPTPPPQDTPMWRKGWTPAGADEATTLCNACGILCVPLASPRFAPPRDAGRANLRGSVRSRPRFPVG